MMVLRMLPYLREYPDRQAAAFLESGFTLGFPIPCSSASSDVVPRNLSSVRLRPEVVSEKLRKEVSLGRMAGPFSFLPVPGLIFSPLGLVPKKDPGQFRLIHHLSYPEGGSVNDGIDSDVQVRWLGIRGLRWSRFLSEFQFFVGMDRSSDIVVVHAGGNDLGARTSRELLRDIKIDCLRLWTSYPGIIIVWSDIVARRVWRHARSVSGLNKARAKLNRSVGRFIARNGGVVVRHRDLEVVDGSLLWPDGEHLNHIGLDIWMLGIQEGVKKALRLWRDERV